MQSAIVALALSGLARDALKVAASLAVAVIIGLAFAVSSVAAIFGAAAPGQAIASARTEEIPADQLTIIQSAAATCGLPWQVLAAQAKVDSNFGRDMATSSAGGSGYGHLSPTSWAGGGNPNDFRDALPAMARSLCAQGAAQDPRRALLTQDARSTYASEVLAVAARYGYVAPGELGAQVETLARAQIGRPYVWGGASPTTSFDCSGLVQWVYRQVGASLPRTAQQQFNATPRLAPTELQVGDLVFFQSTYPSPDRITHVGIYVGGGRMINAPSEGDVVREMNVFTGFWGGHYAGGGRVPG